MNAVRPDVLVVDDDEGIRSTAADIFRGQGYEVEEAEDGDVALQKLSEQPVPVVLLDIRMPRVDGISVLESLDRPPVVVLVSAFVVDDEIRTRTANKVFSYLRKPVAPQQLISVVAEALEEARVRSTQGWTC